MLPGNHWATWNEIVERFGISPWRRDLLAGFRSALDGLKGAGFQTVYLDGNFVTSKEVPNDFDASWDEVGVDMELVDPVPLEFVRGRAAQKAKFRGESFPASSVARMRGDVFLEFFRSTERLVNRKGLWIWI